MRIDTKAQWLIVLFFALGGCVATVERSAPEVSWRLVFENDDRGERVAGSKQVLIDAVQAGKPVRVFTQGRRIGHASDALFLSIFDGEVFAQLVEIQSQRPGLEPTRIEFRAPGEKWRSIVGTNGFVTAYIDGGDPNVRTGGTRWFVQK